jgi:hypothetical protein
MCGGARYIDETGKDWKIYFPNPKAALPVRMPNGKVEWFKWGRRKEEANVPKGFVQGGWARIDSVETGKWDKGNPQRVKLAVIAFMEKDADRVSHWIEVPEGAAVDGLLVTLEGETRVYVVTENTPLAFAWVHDRWPRTVALASLQHQRWTGWDAGEKDIKPVSNPTQLF